MTNGFLFSTGFSSLVGIAAWLYTCEHESCGSSREVRAIVALISFVITLSAILFVVALVRMVTR